MTVELASVKRADMSMQITVVGNLIGAATVAAAPKVSGRLEIVFRAAGRSRRARPAARQDRRPRAPRAGQAGGGVVRRRRRRRSASARPTCGWRRPTSIATRNLFERQLIPRQTYDDTEARYQAAEAQLDLAQAQLLAGAGAARRAEDQPVEHRHHVAGERVRRASATLDPGAWVTPNSAFISVVDISTVRLVANVVEKDLRRIHVRVSPADVEVDAYPGREVRRARRARGAGARSGDADRADRDRDPELRASG